MAGVGAEEGQVLGEPQDAAIRAVVVGLPVGRAEQMAAVHESVGGRVQLLGGEVGQARVVADAVGDVVQGSACRDLRVGQLCQLGNAQSREAGPQQDLAEGGVRVFVRRFFAGRVRAGGIEPGVFLSAAPGAPGTNQYPAHQALGGDQLPSISLTAEVGPAGRETRQADRWPERSPRRVAARRIVPFGTERRTGPERTPGSARQGLREAGQGFRWPGQGPNCERAGRRGGSASARRPWRSPRVRDNSGQAPRDGRKQPAVKRWRTGRLQPGRHRGGLHGARASGHPRSWLRTPDPWRPGGPPPRARSIPCTASVPSTARGGPRRSGHRQICMHVRDLRRKR